jgi:hypothetical protein
MFDTKYLARLEPLAFLVFLFVFEEFSDKNVPPTEEVFSVFQQ